MYEIEFTALTRDDAKAKATVLWPDCACEARQEPNGSYVITVTPTAPKVPRSGRSTIGFAEAFADLFAHTEATCFETFGQLTPPSVWLARANGGIVPVTPFATRDEKSATFTVSKVTRNASNVFILTTGAAIGTPRPLKLYV